MAGRYIKINDVYVFMSLKAESKTVNEVQTQNHDKRFVCNSDFADYSVELVVHIDDGIEEAFLTVWNDRDIIVNSTEVDINLESSDVGSVDDWFEGFLMGDINTHLR